MAKYVIEDTTLTGIADVIRAKTGSADPIPVSDMAGQISAITGGGGGGSAEGIVYVTFMNGDVELCKTACMAGDSTVDPVEDGKIATPTKDPTESTVYTFSGGWSMTDGGEADATALMDVTEDRVVYAVYKESVREYTVNFYDGETLLNTMQVAYGAAANYTPEKEGYAFGGWEPSPTNVTADMDCYATWLEVVASGQCGDNVYWTLSGAGELTISGTGGMYDYSSVDDGGVAGSYSEQVTAVVLEDGVTNIGNFAFSRYKAMTSVTIPSSVTSIGDRAFYACSLLTSVTISNGVTSFAYGAFHSCQKIPSITIPASVTYIANNCFCYNYALENAIFKNTNGWSVYDSETATSGTAIDVTDPAANASYLRNTYLYKHWRRS